MDFFLPFPIKPFPFTISYRDPIMFLGSCFSQEIGNKMSDLKFNILQNPNGILYDPFSICNALMSYTTNKPLEEDDLFEMHGLWHSWHHHSSFSGIDKEKVVKAINQSQSEAHQYLKTSKILIITFGTAFHYVLNSTQESVANCHKAPSNNFTKNLLSIENVVDESLKIISVLEKFNPGLKIIFTVSPVKHIKDGVIENNRSKARLIESIHYIIEKNKNCFYFPAYELVTDVLRDYRFYKNDLVHPNHSAVQFVFEKFCDLVIAAEEKILINKIENIINAANHKPFVKESETHQKFVKTQLENISILQQLYPFIDLSKERDHFLK